IMHIVSDLKPHGRSRTTEYVELVLLVPLGGRGSPCLVSGQCLAAPRLWLSAASDVVDDSRSDRTRLRALASQSVHRSTRIATLWHILFPKLVGRKLMALDPCD